MDGTSIETFISIYNYLKINHINAVIQETTDNTCTIPRYRLYTYSQEKVKKIFNLIYYKNDILKLNRKYNHFLELLKWNKIPRELALQEWRWKDMLNSYE